MKKIVLTLVAAFLSFAAIAQTCPSPNGFSALNGAKGATKDAPVWSMINTPFTATDINGVTVSVADTLAAGKCVVIDYSACWCGPCYRFHNSKNLEAIHNQLGSQVCVLWVETESSNTVAQITGTSTSQGYDGYTQGDWTHYSDGSAVSYRIIDCSSCHSMVQATGYVPEVAFIAPNGYYSQIYGETWGLTISMDNATAVANIQSLIATYPRAGAAPSSVSIDGPDVVFVGTAANFTTSYVSVDNVTSIAWSCSNATPSSATGSTYSATFSNPGTYTVTVTVTNTIGSTSETKTITVRDGWSFGDEMDYTMGNAFESSIGYGGDGEISWGVLYPESLMAGRNYVTNVSIYVENAGQYDLRIYQGGTSNPQNLVYENSYNITTTDAWVDLPIYGGAAINPSQNLWVTLHCNGVNYPAAYCAYNGDPNSHLIDGGTSWVEITDLASSLDNVTWMIKTTTSATQPPFDFSIGGPTEGSDGDLLTFSIAGPSNATYNWTFQGGNPASATGMTASTSWGTAGTYTVTVNGTNATGGAASHTLQVNIHSCSVNVPYTQGFENDLTCWSVYDRDGDGYTWQLNARQATHSGSGNIASASYINGVGAITPDNWLISPKVYIPAEGATLEWWEYGDETNDFAEHYTVMVSWHGNQPEDFIAENDIIFSGEPLQSKTWRKHSRSLSDFANMELNIAFRHHDVTDMFWLVIDDIEITAGNHAGIDEQNTVNIDFYPNPVNDMLYISEKVNEVSVIDVNGRTVSMEKSTNVVDMSNLSTGVYMVRVVTDNGIATKKVVKK